MSWSQSYSDKYKFWEDDRTEFRRQTENSGDATGCEEQLGIARKAAMVILESGMVGVDVDYSINLSGHSNTGHKPKLGYANDGITVNVYQKSPEVAKAPIVEDITSESQPAKS